MKSLKTKCLRLDHSSGAEEYFIYKGQSWTPTFACVDYGEYYEVAYWSYDVRVDKATLECTSNRKKVDVFAPDPLFKASIVPRIQQKDLNP